jgi:hypothetical protein
MRLDRTADLRTRRVRYRARPRHFRRVWGAVGFRWTVSQKNRPLPADHWTSTQPKGTVCSGSLSNER